MSVLLPPRPASRPAPRPWRAVLAALAWLTAASVAQAFDLQGHRGARGLAPENTLAAFDAALDAGVDTLELDTVVTRDDVVVVTHDPLLNPDLTRDEAGRWLRLPRPSVRHLTLAQLQRFDVGRLRPGTLYAQGFPDQQPVDGARIPTLEAVFEHVARRGDTRVRFNIETKLSPRTPDLAPEPEAFVRALLAVIERHGMAARVSLQSFDWRTLQAAQRLAPQIPTVYLSLQSRQSASNNMNDPRWTAGYGLPEHGSLPRIVKAAGGGTWAPFFEDLTPALVREAHALGLKVIPWTVNEPATFERLLDAGIDGVITDRPDLLRPVLAGRGLPLPPPAAR